VTSNDRLTLITDGTGLAAGDRISFAHDIKTGSATYIPANTPVSVVSLDSTTSVTLQAPANAAADVSSATSLAGTDTTSKVVREARNATDKNYVVDSGSNTSASNSTLVLSTTESTVVTRSVDVTAWVDSNGNDVLDTTEYASPTRTVTFKKASEITATTTIDPLIVGSTSVVARVTTDPALNGQQMSNGDVNAMFTFQGSTVEFTPANSAAVYNAALGKWVITATRSIAISDHTAAAGISTVTATAHGLLTGERVVISDLVAGDNGSFAITRVDADTFTYADATPGDSSDNTGTATVEIVAGAYSARAKIGSDYLQTATSGSAAAVKAASGAAAVTETVNINATVTSGAVSADVRKGTLATSATWTFKDADAVLVPAGRPVKVTVTTVNASAAFSGLKINGTSVAQGDVLDLVTDAAGSVKADITATAVTAGIAGDDLVLTAVAEGVSGTSKTATFNWTEGTNTLYDLNGTSSLVRSIAKGGSYTFNFAVTDTWSQPVTGDFRLNVVASGSAVSEVNHSIATGTASVTITDGQLTTGDITVVVTPQKKQTDGTWATTGAPSAITYTLKRVDQSGAAVSLTSADASVAFSTTAVAAGDTRTTQADVTGDGTAGTDAIEVTGVVTDALTGAVRPGAAVTVSGAADLLFVDGAKAAKGSITLFADASGAYSVHIRSNKALFESVVTAAAQGGTKTLKVTFEKAKADTATTATITAPATVEPGKTIAVTVTLADKFGNPVVTDSTATGYVAGSTTPSLKVTYTGPGFVTATIPSVTDANGQVKFTVLLGASDTGSASVSVAYDSNGSDANVVGVTNVASATSSITIAAPVVVVPEVKTTIVGVTKAIRVRVENAKGEEVEIVVNGRTVAVATAGTNSKLWVLKSTKGKKSVKVYVDGDLVAVKTVTVK
jgi:hypothetical protein